MQKLHTCNYNHPLIFPAGPIDVLNMRLKPTGSVRSLPVIGDFILYLRIVSRISSLLIPSIWSKND